MNEHCTESLSCASQEKFSGQELDQPYFLLEHLFLGKIGEPSRIRGSLLKNACIYSLNLKNRLIQEEFTVFYFCSD